jgi:hypothetical protein
MEFRHRQVNVFFRLLLENDQAGVEIDYISFGGAPAGDPSEKTCLLAEALADARIAPASTPRRIRETAGVAEAC